LRYEMTASNREVFLYGKPDRDYCGPRTVAAGAV